MWVWDVSTGRALERIRLHSRPCHRVQWDPFHRKRLASVGADKRYVREGRTYACSSEAELPKMTGTSPLLRRRRQPEPEKGDASLNWDHTWCRSLAVFLMEVNRPVGPRGALGLFFSVDCSTCLTKCFFVGGPSTHHRREPIH